MNQLMTLQATDNIVGKLGRAKLEKKNTEIDLKVTPSHSNELKLGT